MQLFLIFYALPSAGLTIDAFPAAVIGFTVNIGAYTSEVIRATLLAVPKGQWEAAHSISMTWAQSLRRIILPQAARIALELGLDPLPLTVAELRQWLPEPAGAARESGPSAAPAPPSAPAEPDPSAVPVGPTAKEVR